MQTKPYNYESIFYSVTQSGLLIKMSNRSMFSKDAVIPSALPNGQKITAIDTQFLSGPFDTITVDKSISIINEEAFSSSNVREVVWSSECKKIPEGCFCGSKIKKISNINGVTHISQCAFLSSCIEEFVWPSGCNRVPRLCFADSQLKTITNLENVKFIEDGAFHNAKYIEHLDLLGCQIETLGTASLYKVPTDSIGFPYYLDEYMLKSAFALEFPPEGVRILDPEEES